MLDNFLPITALTSHIISSVLAQTYAMTVTVGGKIEASVFILNRKHSRAKPYGITSLKGAKPRVIVKPAGSAGTADPLDQISTVGWKMDGFGVKMLQPEYAVRIECGFSA